MTLALSLPMIVAAEAIAAVANATIEVTASALMRLPSRSRPLYGSRPIRAAAENVRSRHLLRRGARGDGGALQCHQRQAACPFGPLIACERSFLAQAMIADPPAAAGAREQRPRPGRHRPRSW